LAVHKASSRNIAFVTHKLKIPSLLFGRFLTASLTSISHLTSLFHGTFYCWSFSVDQLRIHL
jgi:hypothetical protein